MYVACSQWPNVVPGDDGIRPAGSPDQCFYCKSFIGQPHKPDCVCVYQKVQYRVHLNYEGRQFAGKYTRFEPHFWSVDEMHFMRNESTWCAGNSVDDIQWDDSEANRIAEKLNEGDDCPCPFIDFEVESILDSRPHISTGGDD